MNIDLISIHFLVVSKCKENNEYSTRCESPSDLVSQIPVTNGDIIFANINCALCNGYTNNKPLKTLLACGYHSTLVYYYYKHRSKKEFYEYVHSRCDMSYIVDEKFEVRNSCELMYMNATATYPGNTLPKQPESYSCKLCSKYTFEFGSTKHNTMRYKNPHCALCFGLQTRIVQHIAQKNNSMCNKYVAIKVNTNSYRIIPSFIIELKGTHDYIFCVKDAVNCEFHDLLSKSCREFICPIGTAKLLADKCVSFNISSIPQLLSSSKSDYYTVILVSSTSLANTKLGINLHNYILHSKYVLQYFNSDKEIRCSEIGNEYSSLIMKRNVSNTDLLCTLFTIPQAYYEYVMIEGTNISNNPNVHQQIYLNHLIDNLPSLECAKGSPEFVKSLDMQGYILDGFEYPRTFIPHNSTLNYSTEYVPMSFSIDRHNTSNRNAYICRAKLTLCTTVTFTSSQYQVSSDGYVNFKGYEKHNIRVNGDDTVILKDGHLVTCLNVARQLRRLEPHLVLDLNRKIVLLLGLIGTVISLCSAALVLIIYGYLPALRQGPGKYVMGLISSLMVAQLSFLFSKLPSDEMPWCILVAACQHFAWISSFVWMNIIAIDLYTTFRDGSKTVRKKRCNKITTPLFACVAWLLPLIAVVVIASLSRDTVYGHGINDQCFIKEEYVYLLFVFPLGISVLINLILFYLIVHYVRSTISSIPKYNASWEFTIYIKISTLLGFNWLFGFISLYWRSQVVIWYIFIVLNTLQGFFILLAFICNKKTIGLIKLKYSKSGGIMKYFAFCNQKSNPKSNTTSIPL